MENQGLSLRVTVTPDLLPTDAICDVEARLSLKNDGTEPLTIYPAAAKLSAVSSFAGIGISWGIWLFDEQDQPVPLQELRRWYGPPGNPPSPEYAKKLATSLAPQAEHVVPLVACWIPNAKLEPRHLSPAVLDPQGMDGIGPRSYEPPPGYKLPPPLQDRFPLTKASVLMFGVNRSFVDKEIEKEDFLRGHVVAFIFQPGAYQLRVSYMQASFMGIGANLGAQAVPIPIIRVA